MSQRPRRRASDARKTTAPNAMPAFIGGGILLATLAGWFAWQLTSTLVPVRDGAPTWHPDGGKLAFYSEAVVSGSGAEAEWQADLFEVNVDGTGLVNLTNTTQADEGGPAYSPDGRYLAYDTDRHDNGNGNFEIYLKDLEADDGAEDVRLTSNDARDLSPAWHPNGRTIVFMSDRSSPYFDLYELDVFTSGAVPRRIPTGPSNCAQQPDASSNWFPQYSPGDGARLARHVCRDVHVMVLGSGEDQRLTYEPFDGMYPSWSPDGARLAFMSGRNGRMEIFTMKADGTEQERVMTMPTGDAIDPRWSPAGPDEADEDDPGGKFIAFVHVSEAAPDGETPAGNRVIYLLELDTGRVRRLSR